jgi:hypothetical protein
MACSQLFQRAVEVRYAQGIDCDKLGVETATDIPAMARLALESSSTQHCLMTASAPSKGQGGDKCCMGGARSSAPISYQYAKGKVHAQDMVRPRQIGGDLYRILQGTVAFYRYVREQERIHLGIGLFATDTGTVTVGQPAQYRARIANVSGQTHCISVTIEFHTMDTRQQIDAHCGHLAKRLTLLPHTLALIEVRYDWLTQASCSVDGTLSRPDDFWHTGVQPPRQGMICARLLDVDGRCLEQLAIYQAVSR